MVLFIFVCSVFVRVCSVFVRVCIFQGATTNGEGQSGSSPHHSQTLITPTKTISKRLTKGWIRQSSRGTLGGKSGGATLSSGTVDTEGAQEEAGGSARGLDNFPGGDAMLEVLTRLQRLQETFSSQLQVGRTHINTKTTAILLLACMPGVKIFTTLH